MNSALKKLLTLLLVPFMALVLTACPGNDEAGGVESEAPSIESEEVGEAAEEATERVMEAGEALRQGVEDAGEALGEGAEDAGN